LGEGGEAPVGQLSTAVRRLTRSARALLRLDDGMTGLRISLVGLSGTPIDSPCPGCQRQPFLSGQHIHDQWDAAVKELHAN
jgi:hypothetical protein